MPSSTGSSTRPAAVGRFRRGARTWIVGVLYVAVVIASALIAANSGSQAAAEAGRCLLAEQNGAWGIFATAGLGAVALVGEIPWLRRSLIPAARWTAAMLAVVVFVGHLALLASFGFLLIRLGASTESNLANLATIPFSFAPTLAVACSATLLAPSWKNAATRRIIVVSAVCACVAAAAIAWISMMSRC